jgi:hypothetical protein
MAGKGSGRGGLRGIVFVFFMKFPIFRSVPSIHFIHLHLWSVNFLVIFPTYSHAFFWNKNSIH